MAPQEFRIGNLIIRTDYDMITNENNERVVEVDVRVLNYMEHKPEIYEPIPLTEEWLLKFGFINTKITGFDGAYIHRYFEKYVIQKMQNKWTIFVFCSHLELLTGFDYVHQLQNLYFSLCGKELEVKP